MTARSRYSSTTTTSAWNIGSADRSSPSATAITIVAGWGLRVPVGRALARASSTTWALVRIRPCWASMMLPEPQPLGTMILTVARARAAPSAPEEEPVSRRTPKAVARRATRQPRTAATVSTGRPDARVARAATGGTGPGPAAEPGGGAGAGAVRASCSTSSTTTCWSSSIPRDRTNDTALIRKNPKVCAINSAHRGRSHGRRCVPTDSPRRPHLLRHRRSDGLHPRGGPVSWRQSHPRPAVDRQGRHLSRIVACSSRARAWSTTRGHVHYVATEYGVVNLHGLRPCASGPKPLIPIAHPDFRAGLRKEVSELRHFVIG